MSYSLLTLGIIVLLVSFYNNARAVAILMRVTLRFAYNSGFVRLPERGPSRAAAILMQAPDKERGLIRYLLTGFLCFAASAFVLTFALMNAKN